MEISPERRQLYILSINHVCPAVNTIFGRFFHFGKFDYFRGAANIWLVQIFEYPDHILP